MAGGTYFFTVNLLNRNRALLVEHIDVLRESVSRVKQRQPFDIDAWVVMPDHLHAVLTLPQGDWNYSNRWREIKKRFSKSLPKTEFISNTRQQSGHRGVWQRRFWEHTIRDERDFWHHVNYVHDNPMKHGLVKRVVDWPYSSFHYAVAKGVYDPSWSGGV
ncbi:REP-associated tyrosine transposase (plasmid) [Pseudoalteromonas sp. T1lg65]|uniref:REP-associated tyrosine transposase n=1 Tax=Pseudoalteromonas sp. T1lg65 TaxID=2077101 RepID=UPI003F7A9ECE